MRNDMDVRDLQVFLSVSKHLNYTRAGEEINLSQPSVSVRIRQLEAELRVKLFEQLGKKVVLTDAGQLLVPYANRVMAAVDDAHHAIDELQGLERGSLRIGASTTPGMYLVPQVVARFKRSHPKIDIHLRIKDTREVEDGVLNNEFDFGFVGGHLATAEVSAHDWLTDELLLIVSPDHRLRNKKTVKKQDLEGESFIVRESGSATRATIVTQLQQANFELETAIEMENPESIKKAVQSGLGIAFISKFAIATELKAKTLISIRVRDLTINRELKIVHRKDKHLSRAALAFIEMARRY
jgi:LysR family transcriptional regulator, transcriptional activator of the cysJI operon